MTPLERIIRRIVEGQIRDLISAHPSVLKGVDWYARRDDKAKTLVNSLAKRIVLDLTCDTTIARLRAALLEAPTGTLLASSVELLDADERGRDGITAVPAPKADGRVRGGLARAAALTPERRSEIARNAAAARWSSSPDLSGVR